MNLKFLAVFVSAAYALVIEATDDDIPTYLDKNIPSIVAMHAPWCGHCKTFIPDFEEFSKEYEHLEDQIQFIKIDGDKHRKTSKLFNLEYFPTVMYVSGSDFEEIKNRDAKSMKKFIEDKSGLTPSSKAGDVKAVPKEEPKATELTKVNRESAEPHIIELADDTFVDGIKGKHALVSFTTTWCTYCKKLAPHWEQLAQLYANDDDIAIVNVDCTDMTPVQSLVETFDIGGFPTIIYFNPDESKKPSTYSGARTLDGIVQYFQEEGVSQRDVSGEFPASAGIIDSIDFSDLTDISNLIEQVEASGSKYASVYTRILSKVKENADYLTKESKRLGKLLSGAVKQKDSDTFRVKKNIIDSLIDASAPKDKTEL